MTLRQVLTSGLFALGLLASAQTTGISPAQSLFDQATFLIGFNYNGPATVPNFRDLRKQYQPQLDQACAGLGNRCGYEKARPIIAAIVESLKDPFTVMMTQAQMDDDERYMAGLGPSTPRIGVWVRESAQGLVVTESFSGEPAFEAGIRRGDLITQIGGQAATLARLREAEASKANFPLVYSRRGSSNTATLGAKVAEAAMRPKLELVGNIAVIRIYHLYASEDFVVSQRIHDLLREAASRGARGIVLDLRDTLSGFDIEALKVASAFTDKGGYIYDRRWQGGDETYSFEGGNFFAQEEGGQREPSDGLRRAARTQVPTVVLVNRKTLNSSEMLAYFLQTAGRAKVVGEPTAGALGQSGGAEGPLINGEYIAVSSLRMKNLDGSPFPMRLTPDVAVNEDLDALLNGRDVQLERALELLR